MLIAADWMTKLVARSWDRYVVNSGAGLGIGDGIFVFIAAAAMLLWMMMFKRNSWQWGEKLIVAGGAANLIDRLEHQGVTDWINVGRLWFNLADVYIILGALWLAKKTIR